MKVLKSGILMFFLLGIHGVRGDEVLSPVPFRQEDVFQGQVKDIRLPLFGDEKEVMVIHMVQFSCDCLRAVSYPGILMPGMKDDLWIRHAASKVMDYSYEVMVSGHRMGKLFEKKFLLLGSVKESKTFSLKNIPPWDPELQFAVRKIIKIPDTFRVLPQKIDFKKVMNEFMIVDIRDPGDYEKCYIPGSMNLPLSVLKTKAYLKDKKILILGYGYGEVLLHTEMEILRVKGWKVFLFSGGVSAWKASGGRLEGFLAEEDACKIAASDFYHEKNDADTLVLNISDSETDQVREYLPFALFVGSDRTQLNKKINDYALQANKPFLKIICFNENGIGYEKLISMVKDLPYPGFFLTGGFKSYKSLLHEILQMHSGIEKNQVETRIKGCKSCPN